VVTLGRLAAVIARHDPRMVIALGDSFATTAHQRCPIDRDALGVAGAARLDWISAITNPRCGVVATES
jgi:hypothetical protein